MRSTIGMLLCAAALIVSTGSTNAGDAIAATTLDGATFSLADHVGDVVVVNFWATWCAPCRAEMPALDRAFRRHHASGLEILAISLDAGGGSRKIAAAAAPFAFRVARLADTRLPRSAIPSAVPETRIYGRDGRLRFDTKDMKIKSLDDATIERIVGPLLDEPIPTIR